MCLIALACIANVVLVARTCAGVLRLKVFIPEHVRQLACVAACGGGGGGGGGGGTGAQVPRDKWQS